MIRVNTYVFTFVQGEFYLKMQMWEKGGTAERMCLEFYFNMHTDRA